MASKSSKRALFDDRLAVLAPSRAGIEVWNRLRAELQPISDSYLRHLFRHNGIPLDPLVEGVRQHDLEELERTLLALCEVYEAAREAGNRETAMQCRRLVIEAKTHARMALRRGVEAKGEMIEWMLVWLENPGVFPTWVRLRKAALAAGPVVSG